MDRCPRTGIPTSGCECYVIEPDLSVELTWEQLHEVQAAHDWREAERHAQDVVDA